MSFRGCFCFCWWGNIVFNLKGLWIKIFIFYYRVFEVRCVLGKGGEVKVGKKDFYDYMV